MKDLAFFRCSVCGNMVERVKNGGGVLTCCGKPMVELEANTTDAAVEKHLPVAETKDGKLVVTVGATLHPMVEDHYIEWIALVTDNEVKRIALQPGDKPAAEFCSVAKGEVYAYCNKHGLWKTAL